MSTAAASFDDAYDFDEPARKKGPRKPRAAAPKKGARGKNKKPRRFAFDAQRVARYGAIGMSATIAMAIMVNALVLQKGHHPAPLFGKAIALGPSPVPVAKVQPPEQAAMADDAAPPPASLPQRAAATRQQASPPPVEQEPVTATNDAIGRLIEGHAPPPSPAFKSDSKTVLGAQRALAKLGFSLKPSGTVGPQTRKAIEAFERDRRLPVKGELTHRLVKILSAESGVKID